MHFGRNKLYVVTMLRATTTTAYGFSITVTAWCILCVAFAVGRACVVFYVRCTCAMVCDCMRTCCTCDTFAAERLWNVNHGIHVPVGLKLGLCFQSDCIWYDGHKIACHLSSHCALRAATRNLWKEVEKGLRKVVGKRLQSGSQRCSIYSISQICFKGCFITQGSTLLWSGPMKSSFE